MNERMFDSPVFVQSGNTLIKEIAGLEDALEFLYSWPKRQTRGDLRTSLRACLRAFDSGYLSPTDTVLIAGSSGIGKSTLATALTERFVEGKFQFCVFDPEGDYDGLEGAVRLGDGSTDEGAGAGSHRQGGQQCRRQRAGAACRRATGFLCKPPARPRQFPPPHGAATIARHRRSASPFAEAP
jgi:hypothetical protein